MAAFRINGERLWQSLMEMARIGATARGGVCRVALTDVDRQGRDVFVRWAREAGCEVEIDQMGNIFARRPGTDNTLPPVLTGSHLDTQPTGGKFDGVYGVLAGLEVIRTLNDHHYATRHPVEVVVWTNEEGSRFAPAMVASGVFAGEFSLEYGLSRADLNGVTIGQELDRLGYAGVRVCSGQPVHAYFEAHIEQGPILEAERRVIGVVQGLQGQRWFDCTVQGMESHAGTTPMPRRRDALLGATRIVQAVQGRTHRLGHSFEWAILRVTQVNTKIHASWNDIAGVRVYQQLPYSTYAVRRLGQSGLLHCLHYACGPE